MTTCRVTEIFYSLQGETRTVGLPTVFIRLTGCPLRCGYCDTEYAFHGGEKMTLEAILDQVMAYQPRFVTLTGGEPLAQPAALELLTQLCDLGLEVSLETSGAMDISAVDRRVMRVMDLKTPGSGEMNRNRLENLQHLQAKDQVKMVLMDRTDYEWSRQQLNDYRLADRCEVLFSPVYGAMDPTELAEWIIEDNLPVRFQIQLHKVLWQDAQGR